MTLAAALVLVLVVLALLAGMVAWQRKDAALTVWALGLFGSAGGFIVLLLHGFFPTPGLLVLGTLLIAAFGLSLPVGLRLFLGIRPVWPWPSTVALLVWFGAVVLWAALAPSYAWRLTATSFYMAWLCGEFLVVLVQGDSIPRRLKALLGLVAVAYLGFHVVRGTFVHAAPGAHAFDDRLLSHATFLVSMAVSILWSGGLLLLDSHRLRSTVEADAVELRRLNLLKDKVLAMTGHDLRGPLGNLRVVWGELGKRARRGSGTPVDEELLTLVDRSLAGTQDLLENLFSFAEAQRAGQDPDQRASLPLAVASAIDLWTVAARAKGVLLVHETGDAPAVRANAEAVAAVLRNLIGNAVKFTPSGGRVSVSLGAERGWAFVEVADTGTGIDLTWLAEAEERNRKRSRTGTAGERGSGFGLVLVRELVDGWGGTLTFDTPGGGTKVRVGFPLAAG